MVTMLAKATRPEAQVRAARVHGTGLVSCLYEGTLNHVRHIDAGHRFEVPIVLAYIDLDEVPRAFDAHPFWSMRRPAPVRFRRGDMHGDPSVPLVEAVRATVADRLGSKPTGPIRVLTHLRHWGWAFNPISFYFCFDETDRRVETLVAEVTNTPWHERHAYVVSVPGPATTATDGVRFAKELHVSPFMDMDLDHIVRFGPPGHQRLTVSMDDHRQGSDELVFSARLCLHRRPLDRASMGLMLRRHLLPSHRVSAGIYTNALRLWRQGAPFRSHPLRSRR